MHSHERLLVITIIIIFSFLFVRLSCFIVILPYYGEIKVIIIIAVTRCHILRLKCTKFNFAWGSAPFPLQEITALSRPPNWNFGREGKKEEKGKWRKGKGGEGGKKGGG